MSKKKGKKKKQKREAPQKSRTRNCHLQLLEALVRLINSLLD